MCWLVSDGLYGVKAGTKSRPYLDYDAYTFVYTPFFDFPITASTVSAAVAAFLAFTAFLAGVFLGLAVALRTGLALALRLGFYSGALSSSFSAIFSMPCAIVLRPSATAFNATSNSFIVFLL